MANTTLLDPKMLGFWIKCLREGQQWSQEALAAAAGVDVRTIQRIESGEKASVTTRRAIARGLGYDKSEIFDDPKFAEEMVRFFDTITKSNQEAAEKEFQKQFPDHRRLAVERVSAGSDLLKMVDDVNAMLPDASKELKDEAQELAAQLFDYIRDCIDILPEVSFSERLVFGREIGSILTSLEKLGAAIYVGTRAVQLRNDVWQDKEPLPMKILYATVVPAETQLTEVVVSKRMSFS